MWGGWKASGGIKATNAIKSGRIVEKSSFTKNGYFSAKNACKNLIINLYRFFSVKKALKGIFWWCGGGGMPGDV